ERVGIITREDLETYRAEWSEPVEVTYLDWRVYTRGDLSRLPETLPRVPRLRGLPDAERALLFAQILDSGQADGAGDTTNISVVDGAGNACVLTTSLGLGSGDFLPALDLHLNSMLGEVDLLRGSLEPGDRMLSMMAPTLALDRTGLSLAVGAAGGTRLKTGLLGVLTGILD